jgi:virginiamycin B lyase
MKARPSAGACPSALMPPSDALKRRENMMRACLLAALLVLATQSVLAASIGYFELPEGAFPHDVAPASDGLVWYTDQREGLLGRLEVISKKVERIPLGPGSAPHGVIVGPDGGAWVTDGGQNAIVRVDAATRAVKVFPLPAQFSGANLNTPTFDGRGKLWFTGQSGVYGRLDPQSGTIEAWRAPKGAGPYGITTTPSGEVWFASLAGDYIGRIDSATGHVRVIDPPRPGVGPRRIWSDSKGGLWVSFWLTGELGRYDPARQSWRSWRLPTSTAGCYAVYVDETDHVWATDWQANAIVRFDPGTERFESFPSDREGANVRQLLGRPGEVWGGQSGLGRLVVVRY